jgi:hypothetical protein
MNNAVVALVWATACLLGLIASIVVIKGVLMLFFGFGCLVLMAIFLYIAARDIVLRNRQ